MFRPADTDSVRPENPEGDMVFGFGSKVTSLEGVCTARNKCRSSALSQGLELPYAY